MIAVQMTARYKMNRFCKMITLAAAAAALAGCTSRGPKDSASDFR